MLRFDDSGDKPVVEGQWDVTFNGEVFESYDIKIVFGDDYPNSLPQVFETSAKIRRHEDMHLNPPSWNACLFVSHQRWEIWPVDESFKKFLTIPVHNFFLGQAFYAAHGHWPDNRERGHGNKGIIEYYREKFQTEDVNLIFKLLLEAKKPRSDRQKKCYCNGKTPLRKCHGSIVKQIREFQNPDLLNDAILIFKKLKSS